MGNCHPDGREAVAEGPKYASQSPDVNILAYRNHTPLLGTPPQRQIRYIHFEMNTTNTP